MAIYEQDLLYGDLGPREPLRLSRLLGGRVLQLAWSRNLHAPCLAVAQETKLRLWDTTTWEQTSYDVPKATSVTLASGAQPTGLAACEDRRWRGLAAAAARGHRVRGGLSAALRRSGSVAPLLHSWDCLGRLAFLAALRRWSPASGHLCAIGYGTSVLELVFPCPQASRQWHLPLTWRDAGVPGGVDPRRKAMDRWRLDVSEACAHPRNPLRGVWGLVGLHGGSWVGRSQYFVISPKCPLF